MELPEINPALLPRRIELATRLAAVRESIAHAAEASGRPADSVQLIVVTKTFPATDVKLLAHLGVGDIGESRDQDAAPKHAICAQLSLRWHFIGQLQTNKCASVASYASMVQSVDRSKLVQALSHAVDARGRPDLDVLVQVNLDAQAPGRGGVSGSQAQYLAAEVAATEGVRLCGVMAVAPRDGDPRSAFERLAQVSRNIAEEFSSATIISAGMSGDFASAIAAGATHVRMGAAILGDRTPLK